MKLTAFVLSLQLWAIVDVSLSLDACSKVPDIPHGNVSDDTNKSEYQEGDVIHFSCEAGFTADQTSKYVCTSQGWLVIRQGTCYSCSTLPDVPHAHVAVETRKDEYREEDVIHFTCDLGYSSEFIIKYVCTSEGWLTVRNGSCNPNTGGKCHLELPALRGTTYEPASKSVFIPGETLNVICGSTYWIGSLDKTSTETTCKDDGEWTIRPVCQEVICSNQRDPLLWYWGVSYWQQKKIGDTADYTCKTGYINTNGASRATCTREGWTPKPLCQETMNCGSPPALLNGDTRESLKFLYSHNERVEFRCQRLYTMEGEPYKTCYNGEWTGDMKCLKPCTVNTEAMNTHNIRFKYMHRNKLYPPHNDEIEFECKRGSPVQASLMRVRCLDGEIRLPTCQ